MSFRSLPPSHITHTETILDEQVQENALLKPELDENKVGAIKPADMKNKDDNNDDDAFHLSQEAYKLFYISLPSVVVQLSIRTIFPQTASAIGRLLGTRELAAFSLASLTANLTCQSIIMGTLTAAETLQPRAFGLKQYSVLGQVAIQGFVVCTVLLVPPVFLLCTVMEWLFQTLGQDAQASRLASEWIRIYLLAIPSVLLFRVLQAFLNAQHVVLPLVFASVVASFLVHPVLLHIVIPQWGLRGSGFCMVVTQLVMVLLILLYLYIRPEHNPQTWPGLSRQFVRDLLRLRPLWNFVRLSLGGVLSMSEWWFWETLCFIVGSFGIVPLAAHSIAYNVIPMVFMGAVGLATGLTVRIGTELARNVLRAKSIAKWCMGFAIGIGAMVSLILYGLRVSIVQLFTNDQQVMEECIEIWGRVCLFVFILYVFSINRAILRAFGMQWHIAAIVVIFLWCVTFSLVLYKAIYLRQGLEAVWTILPIAYAVMQVFLIVSYTRMDWTKMSDDIRHELPHDPGESSEVEMESLNVVT